MPHYIPRWALIVLLALLLALIVNDAVGGIILMWMLGG